MKTLLYKQTLCVHPVVLFQIIDAYERRNDAGQRVIGTLLGTLEKGQYEVTNCFCVPHKEKDEVDQVEAELSYAHDMYELNRKVFPNEAIVGWWTTNDSANHHKSAIQYNTRECKYPVHLTVDTTLKGGHLGLKAYVSVILGVPGGTMGTMFTAIPVNLTNFDPEVVSLKLLQKTMYTPSCTGTVAPMLELVQITEETKNLQHKLDLILKYVQDVLARKRVPNNAVGRQLFDLVHSVPVMSAENFIQMLNSNARDLLMSITLAELIKTQLHLNEKLSKIQIN